MRTHLAILSIEICVHIAYNIITRLNKAETKQKGEIKMTNLVETIKAAAEKGYHVFGIRRIWEEAGLLSVGDWCPDSYDWDYENDISTRETTGTTLDGACAVVIDTNHLFLDGSDDNELEEAIEKAMKTSKGYYGDQTLLIGGNDHWEYGWDEDEVIIRDAKVLAVIEK